MYVSIYLSKFRSNISSLSNSLCNLSKIYLSHPILSNLFQSYLIVSNLVLNYPTISLHVCLSSYPSIHLIIPLSIRPSVCPSIHPSIYLPKQRIWLVVWTPLKNISQLGGLFRIHGKIKNIPNHQPGMYLHECIAMTNKRHHRRCSVARSLPEVRVGQDIGRVTVRCLDVGWDGRYVRQQVQKRALYLSIFPGRTCF